MDAIHTALARRREGAPRAETDEVVWLSGIREGITLGTPLAFMLHNKEARPEDYDALEHLFRPGHADYSYYMKYGVRDHRGGGRSSARETAARVVAACIARQLMPEMTFEAQVVQSPSPHDNDTIGGIVACRITGVAAGIGAPLFGKLSANLAAAMMSIPSAIGFEMGAGFAAARMRGSEFIDRWQRQGDGAPLTQTNHCGGVQGGISNGMPVEFRVAFHPVATLPSEVECLSDDGALVPTTIGGRHDNCQVMRAPVIVEAMAALTLADLLT